MKSYRLCSFNIFDVVINKNGSLRIDLITVEKYVIKFRKWFSGFLYTGNHNAFKPMEELKIVQRPGKSLFRPVGQRVQSMGCILFDLCQDIHRIMKRTGNGLLPAAIPCPDRY